MARRRKPADGIEVELVPEEEAGLAANSAKARKIAFLEDYYSRHGRLDAEGVLEEASDPSSPVYSELPWDDAYAAHQYRLKVVRNWIMAWKMVARIRKRGETAPTAAAHRVRRVVSTGVKNVFVKREEAKATPVTRQHLVDQYLNRLRSWCEETCDFEELDELRNLIANYLNNNQQPR